MMHRHLVVAEVRCGGCSAGYQTPYNRNVLSWEPGAAVTAADAAVLFDHTEHRALQDGWTRSADGLRCARCAATLRKPLCANGHRCEHDWSFCARCGDKLPDEDLRLTSINT